MERRRDKGKGYIFERGGIYHVQVKVGGKRKTESLHVSDLRQAQGKFKEVVDKLKSKIDTSEDIKIDCIKEKYKEHLPTYVKRRGSRHVEASKTQPIADKTFKMNLSILKRFLEWLDKKHKSINTVRKISQLIASEYFSSLRKGDDALKESSYNRHIMGLRHIFDVVPTGHNPFKKIAQRPLNEVAEDTAKKQRFEIKELVTMQQKAEGWIRPAMFIGFHTGLRLSDVVCLKWTEIDKNGFIKVRTRKTSKEEIKYAPEVLVELSAWKTAQVDKAGDYVFPEQAAAYLGVGRKVDKAWACKQFQRFLTDTCKIETKDGTGQNVKGFHSLRVSHATYSRLGGLSVQQIQKHLAHSDTSTTEGYIQENESEIKEALRLEHKPLTTFLLGEGVDDKKAVKNVKKPLTAEEKLQKVMKFLEGHKSISGKQREELMGTLRK